ncbi:glycosyltransferase [Mucilaginibacter terrenus]|uniref:Glycosyltransferase n=1 Tax=Mucilaginibacter terrenus TaxID=2482727 RepID=A0A3E2NP83_9SPHI|nr:glycosyltransferase [Mucilaginibacter terrenus]RFZ82773.1 glycosyltransferase [Mucilaginibacter terrenus]
MLTQEKPIRRVLMTADAVGGVWTYALDLCSALDKSGITVCLALMGAHASKKQLEEAAKIPNLVIHQSDYKLEWMHEPWADVELAAGWLLKLESTFKPDIIHLNGYVHASIAWSAPVVVVAHSCVLSWWQAVKHEPAPNEWTAYKNAVQRGLRAANAVVSISQSYSNEIQRIYGPLNNLRVIYNGRDSHLLRSAEKKMKAFAMGRIWDEAKNLPMLAELTNRHNIPIVIAGNNNHPDTGTSISIPNVTLAGILSPAEVSEHLPESYIYIMPAKYEPFGLSVLEAALSGCLLLLADIPTFRELWSDAALFFNPNDPLELDQLLDYVILHPVECGQMIERSSKRSKNLSLENMANSYVSLYKSLIREEQFAISS